VKPGALDELGRVLVSGADRDRQVDVYATRAGEFGAENLRLHCSSMTVATPS
jgi:hypothetical protein